jgi:cell division protein ZapA
MSGTKQIEVQIMGQSYLLAAPVGGEARLLDAVERVDSAMCKIRDGGKVKARDRIAVLAALNLAFDQASSDAPPSAGTSAGAPSITPLGPSDQDRIAHLVRKMDHALSQDGNLL